LFPPYTAPNHRLNRNKPRPSGFCLPRRRKASAASDARLAGRRPASNKYVMRGNISRMKRAALAEAVFERLAAANPEPKGELEYLNPFTLLVAVVLSAQATDAGVNKATRALFATADTPQKMAALGERRLEEAIKTIGLYRSKAKNVIALSRAIVDQ